MTKVLFLNIGLHFIFLDASGHLLDFSPMEKVGTKSGDIDMDDKLNALSFIFL